MKKIIFSILISALALTETNQTSLQQNNRSNSKQILNSNGTVNNGCMVVGCYSSVCTSYNKSKWDAFNKNGNKGCVYKPVYACYKNAKCAKNNKGVCDWVNSQSITTCKANDNNVASTTVSQDGSSVSSFASASA